MMQQEVEALYQKKSFNGTDRRLFERFLDALEAGDVRAAEPAAEDAQGQDGDRRERRWKANAWVKKGILAGFRMGVLSDHSIDRRFRFFDKDTYPLQPLTLQSGVRVVPGGSSIRRGCFVSKGVTCMPPMYINVGAYVDQGTMVDSHALVGSCAQVGRRVHLSAAAQIGGVLEPVGAVPVVIEDDVMVGGNCGVYEGTLVGRRAVLAAGVILTRSTAVYDLVRKTVHRASPEHPLEIPEGAVVVPGSRPASGDFARQHQLSLSAPVIVKYRDEKTEASVTLEEALR
ncbi:MAG TPA: 2,3,4,5-tetrahydropyridine-2,6-dicarboxylate N-succinyltransferase [Acidobacteriota bacterium]|nr:2,3,4,5-tetrahydropyridine-2,6-dicarboxylate N-succinyltransferase [Acidobacteriota bacterium]